MREETQQEEACVYCKEPITSKQWPFKRLKSGEAAHLACYIDHIDDEERKPEDEK